MRPGLGTFVEVGALGNEAAIDAAFIEIDAAQRRWSFQDPASELSRLNAGPGEWFPVERATVRLLRLARRLMLASGGRFDCTLGGALVRAGVLPDHGGARPLTRGDAADIELAPGHARLRRPLRLTLDGIAKGAAVDLAIAALRRRGAAAGWVNAGGDLRVFGGLELPVHRREADGRLVAIGSLRDGALATSVVTHDDAAGRESFSGRIAGRPGRHPAAGTWTVLARSAWRADALTKVAANSSRTQRAGLVERLGGRLFGAA